MTVHFLLEFKIFLGSSLSSTQSLCHTISRRVGDWLWARSRQTNKDSAYVSHVTGVCDSVCVIVDCH